MTEFFEWREAPAAQFAVIGDPVAHSMSPLMHNAWLESVGRDYRYVAIRVSAAEFGPALERLLALGFSGVNVTVPLKEIAFEWVAAADQMATGIGAVNCIDLTKRIGRNTDAPGFLATLAAMDLPPNPRSLLIGAGGSAAAIACALKTAELEIAIWNRTVERAKGLALKVGAAVKDGVPITLAGYDLVVNATSGIEDISLPIAWNSSKPGVVAYDIMYGRETPFMAAARAHGLQTKDGTDMLVEQGALSMEGWLGIPVDRAVLRAALLEGLRC